MQIVVDNFYVKNAVEIQVTIFLYGEREVLRKFIIPIDRLEVDGYFSYVWDNLGKDIKEYLKEDLEIM